MKISKKTVIALSIIVPILALVLFFVLWFNQKPNFSKYHSYAVITDNGIVSLNDEQFQQISQGYANEETIEYNWLKSGGYGSGHKLILYKSYDMSGNCVTMYTGVSYPVSEMYLGGKCFVFDSSKPINIADEIIQEAIAQSESEREV